MNIPQVPESVSDSKWIMDKNTSIPERGIVDFNRVVIFENSKSKEDLEKICNWLKNNYCPGTEYVYVKHIEQIPNCYCFRVTRDSSD